MLISGLCVLARLVLFGSAVRPLRGAGNPYANLDGRWRDDGRKQGATVRGRAVRAPRRAERGAAGRCTRRWRGHLQPAGAAPANWAGGGWTAYRRTFATVHSEFHHVGDAGDASFLEWTSTGRTSQGRDFSYRGASVVEWSGNRIRAFRTYFDPRHLGQQIAPAA